MTAEFDKHAATYDGGLDNPIKRLLGNSPDRFVGVKARWLMGVNLPGWTSLMAAVGLLGGMQFLMLGIIGAYLGRLYDQSKGRPLFMIREIVGGPK